MYLLISFSVDEDIEETSSSSSDSDEEPLAVAMASGGSGLTAVQERVRVLATPAVKRLAMEHDVSQIYLFVGGRGLNI